jgi:hypothetical protein
VARALGRAPAPVPHRWFDTVNTNIVEKQV